MRLVIPYKYAENSEELRFAIRSIVKHYKPGLSGVLLIGDKPEWYIGNHIPMADIMWPDEPGRIWKERSMQLKILAVPDEVFLYSNDDFFALEDFKDDLPYYYCKSCWQRAIQPDCLEPYKTMYENCPDHWLDYDIHVPMIMRKDLFEWSYKLMLNMFEQTPIKTTYINCMPLEVPHLELSERLVDIKIKGEHTFQELNDKIRNRPFFSTHNSAINEDLMLLFNILYPIKSDYER